MDDSEGLGERLLILHHGPDRRGVQRGAGFIGRHALRRGRAKQSQGHSEGLRQLSPHSCLVPLIRQLTAGYHRKTGGLGVFQRATNNLVDIIAGPVSSQLHLEMQILLDSL